MYDGKSAPKPENQNGAKWTYRLAEFESVVSAGDHPSSRRGTHILLVVSVSDDAGPIRAAVPYRTAEDVDELIEILIAARRTVFPDN